MVVATLLSTIFIACSPVIIVSNLLIVAAWFRFKRLRTPSNAFLVSLAVADFSFGACLPMAVIYQLVSTGGGGGGGGDLVIEESDTLSGGTRAVDSSSSSSSSSSVLDEEFSSSSSSSPGSTQEVTFNIRPFSILIVFSAASVLSVAAIALDRFTSVAQPLRYNHFVTNSYVHRLVLGVWLYAMVMGTIGFISQPAPPTPLLITWLALFVFAPSALCCTLSYWYIYMVARSHARAIHSVEVSLSRGAALVSVHCPTDDDSPPMSSTILTSNNPSSSSHHHSYGLTLALILGMVFVCWTPLLLSAVLDTFAKTNVLGSADGRAAAATPILLNSLVNPWLYGFRSSEFRMAVNRILDSFLTRLTGRPPAFVTLRNNKDATSCASNVRLLAASPTATTVQCYGDRNHLQIVLCDQTQL